MKKILSLASILVCSFTVPLLAQVRLTQGAEGWRIVAECDSTRVFAYGSKRLDVDNLPPAFVAMMRSYERAAFAPIDEEETMDVPGIRDVEPLLSTHWAQGSPYNDLCPEIPNMYGYRSPTGCVATAMAQVMYFHKLPRQMRSWKAYGFTSNGQAMRRSMDFGATVLDWDNMLPTYADGSTSEQKKAVATLMSACGIAANMQYGSGESSALMWHAAESINSLFCGLRAEYMEFDVKRVVEELNAGRPIIYSGSMPSGGGHCFVIDGSNTKGYLHCNLGWGGSGDGYYLPTQMNGYMNGQGLIVVHPSDYEPAAVPIAELRGKKATVDHEKFVTEIATDRWYVLNNSGRAGSPCSQGKGQEIRNTQLLPSHLRTEYCAGQLVRFVKGTGGYYIQTGLGDYWGRFNDAGNVPTSASKSQVFTLGPIESGMGTMWLKSTAYIDTNGPGASIVGWGNTEPTNKYSNSAWLIYPVELEDDAATVAVSEVEVECQSLTLMQGEVWQLGSSVRPANASVPHLTWRSSSASVASVGLEGRVEALKAGISNLIATAADGTAKADTCKLRVIAPSTVTAVGKLRNTNLYLLRNTGYSQGYLVAADPEDAHPSLRSVQTLHDNGLYEGAPYCERIALASPGAYWQILTDDAGQHYLYNYGAQKYLTNEGDCTGYVFTDVPTPIYCEPSALNSQLFTFSSGTDAKSYLCAATHLENPAAFWTASDPGSLWEVSYVSNSGFTAVNVLEEVDGISQLPIRHSQLSTLYDLQGRACNSHHRRGLYIQRGVKIIR